MRTKWFYERLDYPATKVSELLTLGDRGAVVVGNRAYEAGDAIDTLVGLLHVRREAKERFLSVTACGDESYLFEFRERVFAPSYWLRWTKKAVGPAGQVMEMPLPKITWKNDLFYDDLWDELQSLIIGLLALSVSVAVVLQIIKALVSPLVHLFKR